MRIAALTPMLRTWDLRSTISFYTEVLGFECDNLNQDWGWALLERDDVAIMFSGPNQELPC